jgi:hypothetical protein
LQGLSKLLNLTYYPTLTQFSFGAALIFELRQDVKGLFYIQILAKNNSMNQPISLKTLRMDNCEDQLCPLGNFFDITANTYVTDSECSWTVDNDYLNGTNITTNGTLPSYLWNNCSANTTMDQYAPAGTLGKFEIALIVVAATLALFSFFLLTLLALNFHKNKVRKTVF